jgi:hypothetical protein
MVGTAGEEDVRCVRDCCHCAVGLKLGIFLKAYCCCWTEPEPPRYTTGAVAMVGRPCILFLCEPPGMNCVVDWTGTDCNIPEADDGRA